MEAIKRGSKGDAVKQLQNVLISLGYSITVDGDFGYKTETIVKVFQKKNGLVADGIVGQQTWNKLNVKESNTKQVDPSVVYKPINTHISKCTNRAIKYLVIHFTAGGNSKKGAAEKNRNVFLKRNASADFVVDDVTMLQINPDLRNYYCWAVGDGKGKYGITNKNSISIEICSTLQTGTTPALPNHTGWTFTEAAIANTVKLSKILMKKYNIPLSNVIRHYDASRKSCPGIIGWNDNTMYDAKTGKPLGKKNTSEKWLEFKKRLA